MTRRTRSPAHDLASALLLLALFGCGSDDGPSEAPSKPADSPTKPGGGSTGRKELPAQEGTGPLFDKLRTCGIRGEDPSLVSDTDELGACFVACIANQDCAGVKNVYCGGPTFESLAFKQCKYECVKRIGDEPFDCGDGDEVETSYVCDGSRDCENGADEAPAVCETHHFQCFDGTVLRTDTERTGCKVLTDCYGHR